MRDIRTTRNRSWPVKPVLTTLAFLLVVSGCDLTVTNPGPIQDGFLDDESAFPAVLRGVRRQNSIALGWVAYTGVYPTGEAVSSGISVAPLPSGVITSEGSDLHWGHAHLGRWLSEQAVARFRSHLGGGFATSALGAEALLQLGYAHRLLGENMCYAVIDNGPSASHMVHFQEAEAAFTEAASVAGGAGSAQIELAAQAARASVRVWLDDWPGAVADAGQVADGFVHQFEYLASLNWDDYNRLYFRVANEPWRRYSVWSTFYETYYTSTGDPRTPWAIDPNFPIGNDGLGTLWYVQKKYTALDDPINVSSGREMRLIEAEDALRQGDWNTAMTIINALRTSVLSDQTGNPLDPWSASNLDEAWTALKRERGIELWLEGRRLPDLRRWHAAGTPGMAEDMTGRSLCFPIGETEFDTNPNTLPQGGEIG